MVVPFLARAFVAPSSVAGVRGAVQRLTKREEAGFEGGAETFGFEAELLVEGAGFVGRVEG